MLTSVLFAGDLLLEDIAADRVEPDGQRARISVSRHRNDPAVRKIQTALLGWDPDCLPVHGADGDFGPESADAVGRFKAEELQVPADQIIKDVGPQTVTRLDQLQAGVDPGPGPAPAPELHVVTFWINGFIPDPGMTPFVVPAPGPGDRSMIVIPDVPFNRFFLGDNRGFSQAVDAPARIHSLVEITNLETGTPQLQAVDHKCGESHELDGTGQIIRSATAPIDRLRFLRLRGNSSVDPEGGVIVDSPSLRFVQLDYEAAASLPLLAAGPDIDLVGVLQIDRDARTFRFRGSVDGFPAFEAYVSFNLGPPVRLFALPPISPIFIIGDVKRPIDVTVPVTT
ncbi:peptidoglycan-binding domain-containing protein [Kribbella catacumbae]|uniref:peptidoglycan-binding domain-containing protein n=1 Tax=Kribbella catacumbae TaxID=460086 RepID=UPI00037E043D|nr:DUF3238 domain-containing protein [Kribbella catacumbae]